MGCGVVPEVERGWEVDEDDDERGGEEGKKREDRSDMSEGGDRQLYLRCDVVESWNVAS